MVGAAISGEVTLTGLNTKSSQADIKILEAVKDAGAKVTNHEDSVTITSAPLKAFTFDATHCPDLFPPLAVLAAVSKENNHYRNR